MRVAAGFGALWVTGTDDLLTRVVPSPVGVGAPSERTVTVGQDPIGVATGAGAVWVANARGGSVSEVDPTTLQVTAHSGVGDDPLSVAVADGRVYVGFGAAQTVRVVSPAPSSKVLSLDTDPRALLAVGAGVWVAGANPGRVISVSVLPG